MSLLKKIVATVVAVVLMIPATLIAQELPRPIPFSPTPFSHEELEQLAAPVALYPDPLLAQVLMAATYPVEVVQAGRFVQANPTLRDSQLDEALRYQNWDDSVKALAQFPQILAMMDDKIDWTQRLGDAFLAQEQDLMDAVQVLRARAQAQGTLTSSPQQIVRVQAPYIYIEPASTQVIYVPVYNPLIVYGAWPYPAHQPYYYHPVGWPVARGFFGFGGGIFVGFGLWGTCDWHRRVVFVDVARYRRFTEVVNVEGRRGEIERGRIGPREGDRLAWQHDVRHRESVEVRHTAAQQHVAAPRPAVIPSHEPFYGRVDQPRVDQPRTGQPRMEQPRVEQPRTGQPRVDQPRVEQPRTGQLRVDQSRVEQPRTGQPRVEQSRVEQPRTGQPRVDQPRVEQPRTGQPRMDQSRVEQPRTGQSRMEQPRVEQPRADHPRAEQPRVEQPRTGQPRVEQPGVEQPQTQHPRVEQPRAEQGRPGRGGQEAVRPSVQPAPRPEPSRPNQGDSPRVQAHVPASPAPAPVQRREPVERGHEKGGSVALPSPSVRNVPAASLATGGIR
jgi:hypothetical protein